MSCVFPAPSAARAIFSARLTESTVWIMSNKPTASFALFDCRCPTRCHRALRWTAGFFSRASCTRFSPISAMPAAIASSTMAAGNVLDTAINVTSLRLRFARAQAAAIRCSTAARFSRIDTMPFHGAPGRAVDGQIGQTIGLLVSGAERMADRETPKAAGHPLSVLVQRDEIGVLYPELAEHLVHQQQRIGDDLHLGRSLLLGQGQRIDQSCVFGDVVGGCAEEAGDGKDLAFVGGHVDAVPCGAWVPARGAIDECGDLQDCAFSK